MKILQICHKVPFPPVDGGCIAMNNITQGLLQDGHQVKILAINTPKHFVRMEDLHESYKASTSIEIVFVDTHVKISAALFNLFTNRSYNIERFRSKALDDRLMKILLDDSFDVVQLESLFVTPYIETIRQFSNAKIVFRSHNMEYLIWERLAQREKNIRISGLLTTDGFSPQSVDGNNSGPNADRSCV